MTQLYVLSQSGDSAVNLGRFEYVYVGDDNKIKAVCGQRVIRLGDYDSPKFALSLMLYYAGKNPGAVCYQMMSNEKANEAVVLARDPAPNHFAANGKKPVRRGGS